MISEIKDIAVEEVNVSLREVDSEIKRLRSVVVKLPDQAGQQGKYLKTDGNETSWGAVSGGTGNQNLWETIYGDSGSTAASSTTDTLTVAGGTGISTSISGDTLTITNTGGSGSLPGVDIDCGAITAGTCDIDCGSI